MTDKERDKLLTEIHAAFFKERPGKKGRLIDELVDMADEYKQAKWTARVALFSVLTIGSVIAAWDKIALFLGGSG